MKMGIAQARAMSSLLTVKKACVMIIFSQTNKNLLMRNQFLP